MDLKTYKTIWKELRTYEDIERLSKKMGLDPELLLVIYTEKIVRRVKRDYYKLKRKAKHLLRRWREGESFLNLAREHDFSPMVMTQIVLNEHGLSKKQIRRVLRNYKDVKDERLFKEVSEAVENDIVYSDFGMELQYKRGKEGEERIRKWLMKKNIPFKEEKDLKGSGKTVDFLLERPLKVRFQTHPEEEREIYWIESKGSFGDMEKIKRDYRKQLEPYVKLWGPGMVVYWFGYLDGMEMWLEARDVKIVSKEFFE